MRMKEEDWDAVLRVNLKGAFNFSKAVLRTMIARQVRPDRQHRLGRGPDGQRRAGQLRGLQGRRHRPGPVPGPRSRLPGASPSTRSRPGFIATAMTDALPEDVKKAYLEIIPLKKFGLPKDVASAVKFLLSDEAAYITGQVVGVNGGMYM